MASIGKLVEDVPNQLETPTQVDYRQDPSAGGQYTASHGPTHDQPIESTAILQQPMPDRTWKAADDDVDDPSAFQSLHSPEELAAYHDTDPSTVAGFSPSYDQTRQWQRAGGDGGRAGNQSIPFGDPS